MIEIIPAVMPQSVRDLEATLEPLAKYATVIQIDVMDGKFVKGRSWPYAGDHGEFEALQKEEEGMPFWDKLDFEADLMVTHPETVVENWVVAGARRIIIHIESTPKEKIPEIFKILDKRVEIGLALNPQTPTNTITEYLEDVDFIQFMGIDTIGIQGEAFDENVLDKIREFHNAHSEIIISVDGGVNFDNAPLLIQAGAKRLVSGSAIFHSENPAQALNDFKMMLKGIE